MARESWKSQIGVVLAVAGSAVGLGNFLRFPGNVAEYGGGAFMLAYFISLLILGLPLCWAEWTMGRYGGEHGFSSSPGVIGFITRSKAGAFLGVIGVVIPVVIYMYYVYIEAWCLGYAVNFALGKMDFADADASTAWWMTFIGYSENGAAVGFDVQHVGTFLILVFLLNFFLIYRGVAKGIEFFCKYAMPTLFVLALVILVRVLTLGVPDPAQPDQNVANGLGFMWNPNKVVLQEKLENEDGEMEWTRVRELVGPAMIQEAEADVENALGAMRIEKITLGEQLMKPQLWLAAAGQIFFSLSIGFGVIITYASYLKKNDDVVLSGLAATSANEFCEVTLGGLITIPAAVAFLGVAGLVGVGTGTFALGFQVLPLVFASMPFGQLFGFLFFFLLFLAAVTSSLSMLQPGIAFLEESLGIGRRRSVALLGFITAIGAVFVVYFSQDAKALDSLDFWAGNVLIYILATIQIIVFGWVLGVDNGLDKAHEGSSLQIPRFFRPLFKFVCPLFLVVIFCWWLLVDVLGLGPGDASAYVTDLVGENPNQAAIFSLGLIILVGAVFAFLVATGRPYQNLNQRKEREQ